MHLLFDQLLTKHVFSVSESILKAILQSFFGKSIADYERQLHSLQIRGGEFTISEPTDYAASIVAVKPLGTGDLTKTHHIQDRITQDNGTLELRRWKLAKTIFSARYTETSSCCQFLHRNCLELTHCTVTETSGFYVHEIDLQKDLQLKFYYERFRTLT